MDKILPSLSPFYNESILDELRKDIQMHLSMILSGGYEFMMNTKEELLINIEGVHYSDLSEQKLKTPQIAVILLEVADFLFHNQGVDGINSVENQTIHIPESYTRVYKTQASVGGLFGEIPITPAIFCLSQSFHLLRGKLIERQTGLFHILFLKTCLMLERSGVPSEFIVGNEFSGVNWLALAKLHMTGAANIDSEIKIQIDGIELYPKIMEEIYKLYEDLYTTKLFMNQLTTIK